MKPLLLLLLFVLTFPAHSQKREELFSYSFKPSNSGHYYYVVTEKQDSLWHRKAYYVSQKTQAMEGWYKDEAGKNEHGRFNWFHTNRNQKSSGHYINGKKDGVWMEWNEQGGLIDSSSYKDGKRVGIGMRWHDNGMGKDSFNFDETGNGVQVSWFDDGHIASAGRWLQDKKQGRWKYFHKNGNVLATEDYFVGKKTSCLCYDEAGVQLDSLDCDEKEALPAGGKDGWRRFLEQGLQNLVEAKARSREWSVGQVTVLVRFVVEKDGTLSEFTPLTQYGKGIEDEVIRMLRRSPKWIPGRQWGRPVKSYHTQPVTFTIQ